MATQYLDGEKLNDLKESLVNIKEILCQDLYDIEKKYKHIIYDEIWEGKKSEAFRDSFEKYWYDQETMGLGDVMVNDFSRMIDFVDDAIEKTNETDTTSADDIAAQGDVGLTTMSVRNNTNNVANQMNITSNSNAELSFKGANNNIIDTATPVVSNAQKYDLTTEEMEYLAYVAFKEQGSVEGAKIELSLIANRYEKYGQNYDNIVDYVKNSGWFSSSSTRNYSYPGDDYVSVVENVLVNGNRYLSSDVDQHYSMSAVQKVTVNGVEIDKNDRSAYIPYETVVYENNKVCWTFVGFAPTNEWGVEGDPFGIG